MSQPSYIATFSVFESGKVHWAIQPETAVHGRRQYKADGTAPDEDSAREMADSIIAILTRAPTQITEPPKPVSAHDENGTAKC